MPIEEASFLVVMKGTQIVDVSLTPGDKTSGYLTPIVGIDNGIQIEFDRKTEMLFWVEGKEDDNENVSQWTKKKQYKCGVYNPIVSARKLKIV